MYVLTRIRPARSLRLLLSIAVGVLGFCAAPGWLLGAGAPTASPDAIYAAFTINLIRFISWPESALGAPGTPFLVGTFPHDPINAQLDEAVQGEMVAGHPVRTIRLHSAADAQKCQMVFLSHGVGDVGGVLEQVRHRPVLAVSDIPGFLSMGGHVEFVPHPPHARLQVSAVNLKACGLEARAQLLRIAATP